MVAHATAIMELTRLGPYVIGPRIGKGGMGSVYKGTNADTGEPAAIKVLAPQLAASEGFRERFQAEVESLKTLRHEGIVRLLGYGEEQGTVFYAMELVDGRSLEEELKAGRRFDWREVVDIAIQVCRALKHAHDHGIIHRDIKPANILIDKQERIKLADFGIARLFGGNQLTMAGGVLGTADYMSPEQAEGKPVTDRSDQYSLGGVMYALLAGRPPFRATNLIEMLQLQRFAEPEPVKRYAPGVPEQLDLVIRQLLSKSPEGRFPNTLVLSRHLEAMRRALSRPQPLEPGEAFAGAAGPPAAAVPLDMAITQADQTGGQVANPDSDFDVDESLDLKLVDGVPSELATIGSEPTLVEPAPKEPPASRDHFTAVGTSRDASTVTSVSLAVVGPALALATLVAVLGWFGWRLMQPKSADQLYALFETDPVSPDIERLRQRDEDVSEFLARYPDDPRSDQVRQLKAAIELDNRQRYFATVARGRGASSPLMLCERMYLEAWQLAETEPEVAAETLRKVIALYPSESLPPVEGSDSDSTERRRVLCVELARQQLSKLEEKIARWRQADLKELEGRVAAARKVYPQHPQEAIAICESLIEQFEGQSWAALVVARAQESLSEWGVASPAKASEE